MNGGVFLGLNGTVVKSHGSADATGVSAAIKLAFQLAKSGFQDRLAARVAAERDRELRRYDTLIIDEAHERSLNIDFLLGYLKELLPRRPDLKVIITSATIDPERFSKHFGDAPVVNVEGRGYPVEVRWRPLGEAAHDRQEGMGRQHRGLIGPGVDDVGLGGLLRLG